MEFKIFIIAIIFSLNVFAQSPVNEVWTRVEKAEQDMITEVSWDGRAKIARDLQIYLAGAIKNPQLQMDAIRFDGGLEVLFRDLNKIRNKSTCQDAKAEILFQAADGSGFSGELIPADKECLKVIAAFCHDPSLTKLPAGIH